MNLRNLIIIGVGVILAIQLKWIENVVIGLKPLTFLLISVSLWAVLQFGWIASLIRRFDHDKSSRTIANYALLSALNVLRTVFLVFTVSTAVVIVIIGQLEASAKTVPLEQAKVAIGTITLWLERLKGFGPTWSVITTIALIIAMVVYAHRQSKIKATRSFNRVAEEELKRIRELKQQGQLELLPSTLEMVELEQKISEMYGEIESSPAAYDSSQLEGQLAAAIALHEILDIQRYMNIDSAFDELALPEPSNLAERLQTLFISRGLVNSFGRVSKIMFIASLFLLIPSMLGIYSTSGLEPIRIRLPEIELILSGPTSTAKFLSTAATETQESLNVAATQQAENATATQEAATQQAKDIQATQNAATQQVEDIQATQTAVIKNETATQESLNIEATATQKSLNVTATQQAEVIQATETADATIEAAEILESVVEELISGLGPISHEITVNDRAIINQVVDIFEAEISAGYLSEWDANKVIAVDDIRSSSVRNEILSRAEDFSNGEVLTTFRSGSAISDLSDEQRVIIGIVEDALHDSGSNTKIPRLQQVRNILRTKLEEAVQRRPALIDFLRTELASFQQPARISDIERALVDNVFESLLSPTGNPFAELIIPKLGTLPTGPHAAELNLGVFQYKFITNLFSEEGGLETAVISLRNSYGSQELRGAVTTILNGLPMDDVNSTFNKFPPAARTNLENRVDLNEVIEQLNSIIQEAQISTSIRLGIDSDIPLHPTFGLEDTLLTYSDVFPAHNEPVELSARTENVQKWAGDWIRKLYAGGYIEQSIINDASLIDIRSSIDTSGILNEGRISPDLDKIITTTAEGITGELLFSPIDAIASHSFSALRGFSRVGGVLIGNQPSGDVNAFTDIEWDFTNEDKIIFTLTDVNGDIYESIPIRPSIAYYALNYAADARPVAVTMTNVVPMTELRILLNPTLVDTPMGYRIIELDRFVDDHALDDNEQKEPIDLVTGYHILYSYVRNIREIELLKALDPDENTKIDMLESENSQLSKFSQIGYSLTRIINIKKKEFSPLAVKNEFYDQDLVNRMYFCRTQNKSLDSFSDCIQVAAARDVNTDDQRLKDRWSQQAPSFKPWSGVREKEYDTHLSNLLLINEIDINNPPLRFMRQIAFTSPPGFLPNGQDSKDYIDETPWEFPEQNYQINGTTLKGVTGSAFQRDILIDSSEFTILQRLFRAALDQNLGNDFPVEKLVRLAEALEAYIPNNPVRTLRWNTGRCAIYSDNNDSDMQSLREALGISMDDITSNDEIVPGLQLEGLDTQLFKSYCHAAFPLRLLLQQYNITEDEYAELTDLPEELETQRYELLQEYNITENDYNTVRDFLRTFEAPLPSLTN